MLPAFSAVEICEPAVVAWKSSPRKWESESSFSIFMDARGWSPVEVSSTLLAWPNQQRQHKSYGQQDSQNTKRHVVNVNPAGALSERSLGPFRKVRDDEWP